jgi:hypothetical protein
MPSERRPLVPRRGAEGNKASPEAALAARLLRARVERDAALGSALFGDPAWDMLLTLYVAHGEGSHMSAAAVCATQPGASSARRLLKALEEKGMVVRVGDADGDDRAFVYLSGDTARRLRDLLRSWL